MLKQLWLRLKGRGPKPVAPEPQRWTIEVLAEVLRSKFDPAAKVVSNADSVSLFQEGTPIAYMMLAEGGTIVELAFEQSMAPHHSAAIALDINDVLPVGEIVGYFSATKLDTEGASVN